MTKTSLTFFLLSHKYTKTSLSLISLSRNREGRFYNCLQTDGRETPPLRKRIVKRIIKICIATVVIRNTCGARCRVCERWLVVTVLWWRRGAWLISRSLSGGPLSRACAHYRSAGRPCAHANSAPLADRLHRRTAYDMLAPISRYDVSLAYDIRSGEAYGLKLTRRLIWTTAI